MDAKRTTTHTHTTTSCRLCPNVYTSGMDQCDACDLSLHFQCVNATSDIKNHPWICESCTMFGTASSVPKDTKNPKKAGLVRSYKSSRISTKRRIKALQKLEEEQAIRLDVLNKKYRILESSSDNSDSTNVKSRTKLSKSSSMDHTSEWATNLRDISANIRRRNITRPSILSSNHSTQEPDTLNAQRVDIMLSNRDSGTVNLDQQQTIQNCDSNIGKANDKRASRVDFNQRLPKNPSSAMQHRNKSKFDVNNSSYVHQTTNKIRDVTTRYAPDLSTTFGFGVNQSDPSTASFGLEINPPATSHNRRPTCNKATNNFCGISSVPIGNQSQFCHPNFGIQSPGYVFTPPGLLTSKQFASRHVFIKELPELSENPVDWSHHSDLTNSSATTDYRQCERTTVKCTGVQNYNRTPSRNEFCIAMTSVDGISTNDNFDRSSMSDVTFSQDLPSHIEAESSSCNDSIHQSLDQISIESSSCNDSIHQHQSLDRIFIESKELSKPKCHPTNFALVIQYNQSERMSQFQHLKTTSNQPKLEKCSDDFSSQFGLHWESSVAYIKEVPKATTETDFTLPHGPMVRRKKENLIFEHSIPDGKLYRHFVNNSRSEVVYPTQSLEMRLTWQLPHVHRNLVDWRFTVLKNSSNVSGHDSEFLRHLVNYYRVTYIGVARILIHLYVTWLLRTSYLVEQSSSKPIGSKSILLVYDTGQDYVRSLPQNASTATDSRFGPDLPNFRTYNASYLTTVYVQRLLHKVTLGVKLRSTSSVNGVENVAKRILDSTDYLARWITLTGRRTRSLLSFLPDDMTVDIFPGSDVFMKYIFLLPSLSDEQHCRSYTFAGLSVFISLI